MRAPRFSLFAIVLLSAGCGSRAHDDPSAAQPDGGAPASQPDSGAPACNANVSDIEVSDQGLYGYPPYAAADCRLVYVAKSGALLLRDLTSGAETQLEDASLHARRPTIAADTIAWEATDGASASVVRVRFDGKTTSVSGAFDHSGEPRTAANSVVFTGWKTKDDLGDTDVYLWDAPSGRLSAVYEGAAQQRFADVSDGLVAYTDFAEDPDGRFDDDNNDLADVVLYDRATRAFTPRKLAGKQAFPMIASATQIGYLHWDWAEIHPEPKLVAYWLRVGNVGAPPAGDLSIAHVINYAPPYVRPALGEATLEWIDNPEGGGAALMRAPIDGSRAPAKVDGLDGLALYAPSAAKTFTVLATRAAASVTAPALLRSVRR
jgi:hypothetical protein